MQATTSAAILLAHGSSDATWLEPFTQLTEQLKNRLLPQRVELAFLELAEPSLITQVQHLVQQGYLKIEIIPLFFAKGQHLRHGVPRLLEQLQQDIEGLTLSLHEPVGLEAEVLNAIGLVVERKLK